MDRMTAYRMYRAGRTLGLVIVITARALLAALILAEDLVIQARSWVLAALAERRERRALAAAARAVTIAQAEDEDGALTGRVVPLEELRRSRTSRQEPA
jgi:hypothetical protein